MLIDQPAQILALIRNGQVTEVGSPAPAAPHGLRLPSRTQLVLGFAAIYLIWGSTYLGIRYAVETIPPFLMMGIRHLTAGVLVFAWARSRGASAPRLKQWWWALIAGAFLFLGGHGVLAWGEQKVPSGLAALLCATLPLWTVLLARVDATEPKLGTKAWAGILMGFGGVALLIGPDALNQRLNWLAAAAVLSSALLWVVGTSYTRQVKLPDSKVLSAAMQMICGGALLLIAGVAGGEAGRVQLRDITFRSVFALAYLIAFGSIVAFTVYTWLVSVASPSMVSTYAYVNPVIAVVLGWALAHEALGLRMAMATMVIVAGVVLVTTRRKQVSEVRRESSLDLREVPEFAAD
ncbi:MAG TPA: EamA family transporter [Terriglobales bacterium]|nr:EamA family transporter [Terriglobales bacterium]